MTVWKCNTSKPIILENATQIQANDNGKWDEIGTITRSPAVFLESNLLISNNSYNKQAREAYGGLWSV